MKMLVATEDKGVGNSATDIKAQTEQMSFHFILIYVPGASLKIAIGGPDNQS